MVVDIPDVVTYTNIGDHRLRGFWVVGGGQISPCPIDFHRRPYNTLPCERVMQLLHFDWLRKNSNVYKTRLKGVNFQLK